MIKKTAARDLMRTKRNKLDEFFIKSASLKIAEFALDYIEANSFKNIAIYMSIKNEPRIEYVIDLNKEKKFDIFLPFCKKEDHICFNKLEDINSMRKDYFGISCPKNDNVIDEKDIDVFFVPGLAFDTSGNRVGYGKGCFDRILKNSGKSFFVGVCYDFQLISGDILETDDNDIGMDLVLTEKGMHSVTNLQ
ncbi:MAG: 5-formyltetrahydrofolate cyclo-ligase [Deltaproteobacteria bacterium]|jgi:5-formyltetrahydrofolate cyclo-ligase|nr:5-formyltetrahydrofolate cyclo-ligase [Deltaproteobacteria bacterium]